MYCKLEIISVVGHLKKCILHVSRALGIYLLQKFQLIATRTNITYALHVSEVRLDGIIYTMNVCLSGKRKLKNRTFSAEVKIIGASLCSIICLRVVDREIFPLIFLLL